MILLKTPAFIRAAKSLLKKFPTISKEFQDTLNKLSENPFNPLLRTHKLKGPLKGSYACSINYEFRIVFQIINEVNPNLKTTEHKILLEAVGPHEEIY